MASGVRRFSDGDAASTSIVFEKLGLPLSPAVGLTAFEAQAPNLKLSFRDVVRAWMVFFRNVADSGEADLRIRAQKRESGWLDLEFRLHQPDPPLLRVGDSMEWGWFGILAADGGPARCMLAMPTPRVNAGENRSP